MPVKRYGNLCKICQNHSLDLVMSRDLASNSENFYLSSNSALSFRKNYQIWGKLVQEQKSYRQKQIGGRKHPPPGLNCKVSHEKSSSASFFTSAKVTSQILLDQASRALPYINWAFEHITNPGGGHKGLPL